MFNGARVIGPALGGLVLAAVGAGWCFLLNGVTFLAVIAGLMAMRMSSAPPRPPSSASAWQQLKDGLHYAGARSEIVSLLLLASVFGLFGNAYSALLPAFVDQVYNVGANGYGFLNAAVGLGAVTSAFMIAQFVDRARRGTWLFFANQGFSVMLFIFAFNKNFPLALLTGFGLGLCFMMQSTNMNSLLQTRVDDAMRGRVLSLYTLSFFGLAPFGNLISGALAQSWTLTGSVAVFAAFNLVASVFIFIKNPKLRTMV
jgi:MFS family permease